MVKQPERKPIFPKKRMCAIECMRRGEEEEEERRGGGEVS
jgi:hypothetical protein